MSTDAQKKALERFKKYFSEHPPKGELIRSVVALRDTLSYDKNEQEWHYHLSDHIIGWARRELVRRGWGVSGEDWTAMDGPPSKWPIIVKLGRTGKRILDVYHGLTLLDCFLDAIEATEPGKEPDDGQ